jgi:predicted Zn-dependent protease with MMP-like domain
VPQQLEERSEAVLDSEDFARLVREALDALPEAFLERLENVQVDVAEWPTSEELAGAGLDPEDKRGLLGLYHGVPLTGRTSGYMALPDHITIYQRPIEAAAGLEEEAIKKQVRRTVMHEIAHYYGIDDGRLEELGAY